VSRILLLLDQKENRALLADELARSHELLDADDDGALDEAFDLCVVDGRALDRLWEKVQARKQAEQPVFLPVLLVTSRPGVKMITRHLWRSVDELIITPIEKPELSARVEILLRARGLSLALGQRADEAERASAARDDVLAVVSHDLRNPLNLVFTSSSFLLDIADDLPRTHREQLVMIRRAAGQMNRLIQDLLEVASVEAGHFPMELRPEPVEPLVREACTLLEHAAAVKSIELECHFDDAAPLVHADRERVLQVLGNLLGNAVKFTPEGGAVQVRADRLDGFVRFAVADTGAGIAEDELSHVFDRFWQARRSRDGGAGLGLAIARGIVKAHGGEMWAESEPGRGSTFSFTLPAEPRETAAAAA
jgi:signal transduction histidine kinase